MRLVASLLAALALSASLAGCMGDDAPAAPAANSSATDGDATNATIDDGTTPMSVEAGLQPHIHDYWQERERVTLMDAPVTIDPQNGMRFTFFNAFRGEPGVGGTLFELPEGAIVYEGTGQLELTATWTDPTVTGLTVRYASAQSTQFGEPQTLASGSPLVVDVAPAMTDMPHATTSRWQFLLLPGQGQSAIGTIQIKVDVVKMRDVTKFPGHPQLFEGAHTMVLFQGSGSSSQSNFVTQSVGFATGSTPGDDALVSERVVPMETMTMTANLTVASVTTSAGEASDLRFLYKPANSRRYYQANLVSGSLSEGTLQFAFPVSMEQTDSPYADTSQWRFDVRVATEGVTGTPCDRCADAKVDYEMEIVAYDNLLDVAGPDPTLRQDRGG